MTSPLIEIILSQDQTKVVDAAQIATQERSQESKPLEKWTKSRHYLTINLPPQLKRQIDLAKECGSSSWLSVLYLYRNRSSTYARGIRNSEALRYGRVLPNTPRLWNCGKAFQIDHAMTCHMGRYYNTQSYATMRSETRQLTYSLKCAQMWAQNPTSMEPLSGETLHLASANANDGARGVWTARQDTLSPKCP